jgi:hypothetical protein
MKISCDHIFYLHIALSQKFKKIIIFTTQFDFVK